MSEDLGFSVTCYRGDIPLLRGCLESIRFFAPDAPICLIADGGFSTRAFEKRYGAVTIRRANVVNKDLRKWSFGFGITKMIAFWESPFDRVFHVDADAVLWGDIRKNLPAEPWDVVFNEPHEVITPHIQNTQYFDPSKIFGFIPEFPWRANPYFQAGVVCVRKNSLDLDEYIRMLELQRKHPDVFINGDQGMLNILVFRAVRAGLIRALAAHLQTVVPVFSKEELCKRFTIEDGQPALWEKPSIIHWAGSKPWAGNPDVFRKPMDYFRDLAMGYHPLLSRLPEHQAAAFDEWLNREVPKHCARLKRRLKSALGREA